MMRAAFPLLLLALAACSDRSGTDGSESDFASRVGAGNATPGAGQPGAPVETKAAKGPPPANADVFALEKLGDISGVDLGPRAGGCTFSSAGTEMLVAAGPADRALPGKGVVRIGGKLIELDTPPGGLEAIEGGTTFTGEGFSVQIQPTGKGQAMMTIAQGEDRKAIVGDYVCA
ncbi:MAG: hypothetical protein K2Y17_00030 [Qipengyuania sp.]|nr:hypothetical protein [Qipengyuania sp.]